MGYNKIYLIRNINLNSWLEGGFDCKVSLISLVRYKL